VANASDIGWGLYVRVMWAFFAPINELWQLAARAAEQPDPLAPFEPERAWHACSAAISAVSALEFAADVPAAARPGLLGVEQHRAGLLGALGPAAWALGDALQKARALGQPPGWVDGVIAEAVSGQNDPNGIVGRMAAVGGLVGNLFFQPGLGSTIGYAVGTVLAHLAGRGQADEQRQTAFARLDEAWRGMANAIDALFAQAWGCVHQALRRGGEFAVRDASFFAEAERRWREVVALLDRHTLPENVEWARGEVTRFLRESGPHPGAVHAAVRLSLPPYGRDFGAAAAWAGLLSRVYPFLPEAYEAQAEACLGARVPEKGLEWVDAGQRIAPGHRRLALLRAEALAALGLADEARTQVAALWGIGLGGEAWLACVRGMYRSGLAAEAARAAREWAVAAATLHGVAYRVRLDPLIGGDISFLAHIPEFARLIQVPDWELQGAVEMHLPGEGMVSFLGGCLAARADQTGWALPGLARGERMLYLLNTGGWFSTVRLMVTTSRVFWQGPWQEAVVANLEGLSPGEINAEGRVLKLAGHSVGLNDPPLAWGVAAALKELASAVRRLAANRANG
jgi:hypothetical protein